MEEIHLIIIWSKGLVEKEKIINDINEKLEILEIYNVAWSKDKFSENLSRFYGENLPKNSGKERHCGNDTFVCIVVKDCFPIYENRNTSKGDKIVNSNLFDLKQIYRRWTGGGHKIHATDDTNETKLQLALLFGKDYNSYLKNSIFTNEEINFNNDLVGSNGWDSFEELFSILNLTCNYVILRNFDDLDEQLTSLHPDVDLLVENKVLVANILNAYPTTNKKYRVQYDVTIGGKSINFDLRYVGDNYYCSRWEQEILQSREKYKYFYIPNKEMLLYSLVYHTLVHKPYISKDYVKQLVPLFEKMKNEKFEMKNFIDINLLELLLAYMKSKHFVIMEPNDLTVTYNHNLISKKIAIQISNARRRRELYLKYRSNLKYLILKVIKKFFR